MNDVKGHVGTDTRHAAHLLGATMGVIRETFSAEDWDGLRPSHFRLLSFVPEGGINVTELALRLRMTKQGCGQFVTALTASGHLDRRTDSADRRVRVVARTAKGDDAVDAFDQRMARIERDWAERVGARRYATFRRVMLEISAEGGSAAPGASSGNRRPAAPR